MAIVMKKTSRKTSPAEVVPTDVAPAKKPVLFPVAPLKEGVVFPHTETVLVFGRNSSKLAVEAADSTHKHIVIVAQKKDTGDKTVKPTDVYRVGTLAKIERLLKHEGEIHVLVRGLRRVKLSTFTQIEPYLETTTTDLKETVDQSDEFAAQLKHLTTLFKKTVQAGKPVEFFHFMKLVAGTKSHELVDHIASTLDLPTPEKQTILEDLNANSRIEAVIAALSHEEHILDIEQKINSKTKKRLDDRMREGILRERLAIIQKELGEVSGDDDDSDLNELQDKLEKIKLPSDVHERVEKELRKLSQMSPAHGEYAYTVNWIETILNLPWTERSRTRTSIKRAEAILNDQHYGLEKVKERILEHLAVLQLNQEQEKTPEAKKNAKSDKPKKRTHLSTILCFVGPPGVGKTSIGRSIAEALGRDFAKISLGGVHDEAEIRGHRRTYVGAMPGRIVQALISVKSKNPVFILDEIDKLGNDFRGDPSSALLEALDPEQNGEFADHYLGLPFDLSEVMFIATANVLHTIPGPLRDRLEIVEYSGYTQDEKFHIAKQYLLDQVLKGSALQKNQFTVSDDALKKVIQEYTREAGVRSLKRELGKLARKSARQIAEKKVKKVAITPANLYEMLGPPRFLDMDQEKQAEIGLVNGLAWTSVGGEILPIEAVLAPGKEGFTLTGQLGDVMKESAQAAYTHVRSQAETLGIPLEKFEKSRLHIHAPEGAVPKDGPSAGIAMVTAIASVFLNRPVRHDLAMTGEVTLRGKVLPIGGLKEKLIAAHRAGITTALIPAQNEKDLVDIPKNVRTDIKIIPVSTTKEVLEHALAPVKEVKRAKK
jgi:ATP-dependent Lon protease